MRWKALVLLSRSVLRGHVVLAALGCVLRWRAGLRCCAELSP